MKIPPIEHALDHITAACEKKLAILYPKGIPEPIQNRYQQELSYLSNSEYADDFELFRRISEEARKSAAPIRMRGNVMGSFLYFLLGENCFNPLPVYYYCRECGHYEPVQTHLFGIDLPSRACPHCKTEMDADGFNLSIESVWGPDGKKDITFEYSIPREFSPFARRVITDAYPDNQVVPCGIFQIDPAMPPSASESPITGIDLVGYTVLPSGTTLEDYSDLISCLEDGEPCVTGGYWELTSHYLKPIRLYPLNYLDFLLLLQRATGFYVNELTPRHLRDITWSSLYHTGLLNQTSLNLMHELKPKTFKDIVSLDACSHNTFSWNLNNASEPHWPALLAMIHSDAFQKYPCFTREDVFDCLVEEGVDRKLAYEVSEMIRKGYASSPIDKQKEQPQNLSIPAEMLQVAENYRYLFPRAHAIEYILMYAQLACYARMNGRAFSKIVYKK